ncbi:hypothetical protein [Paraglaciecola sp.]|uniref:hypothetical protein n=1 Tax=Paraglaciecola sp. TaxID=1920173 RepID=UPI0030F38DE3
MNIPMMECNAGLNGQSQRQAYQASETAAKDKLFSVITLDLMGFVLIFAGLGQQYGRIDLLPHSLSFAHSGLAIVTLGLIMTLPFLAWTLRSSEKALSKISG